MDREPDKSSAAAAGLDSDRKPVIIGLYGLPGSGKSFLLNQLKQVVEEEDFAIYEGSKVIDTVVPGGLSEFQKLDQQDKEHWRQRAIDTIKRECIDKGQTAIVAGHFMFWSEEENAPVLVCTRNDLDAYTHILYLDTPPQIVFQRRLDDRERNRPDISVSHLQEWQQAEKTELRRLCQDHHILWSLLPTEPSNTLLDRILTLLFDFSLHSEEYNISRAESRMDGVLAAELDKLETVLAIDGDKILGAEDAGSLFWEKFLDSRGLKQEECPLKTLFSSPLKHSYTAFRQAVLMYEEATSDREFDSLCQDVASSVAIYPEFVSLLQLVAEQKHVAAVVVTCGLRQVWDKVLEREGLSNTVKVIGGTRMADGFVVTPEVKGALVSRLRYYHRKYVWAFGDSPLDMDMLTEADRAVVVVGDEESRSRSMDDTLKYAIDDCGFQACQAVLASNAWPRLDTTRLPLIQLTSQEFVDSILSRHSQHLSLRVRLATDKSAAKLLMSPTRDATVSGPKLREAHRHVGWYLGTEFVGDVVGIEQYPIPHVQGHATTGYRLSHESQTLIVALMRGGEPMALGVNDAFPLASFLHASCPSDIENKHLQGQVTVLLVDSVVNSGKTVLEFVRHIRSLHVAIHIVVVAGVVQEQVLSSHSVSQTLSDYARLSIVALRSSDNKFTGSGTTDTGNRLFNTTHLA